MNVRPSTRCVAHRAKIGLGALTVAIFAGAQASSRSARAEPHHGVQAALDVGVQSVRDDALVPLAHTGPRLTLSPSYYGDMPFGLLLADARIGLALVFGAEGERGGALGWGGHLSTLFFLSETEDAGVAIGPALGSENETFYFDTWDDAHGYWIGAQWLGARVHGRRALNADWRFDYDGQLAALGFLSRPPAYRLKKQETSEDIGDFLGWPTREPRFATLADFQVLRASADFFHTRNRGRVPDGIGVGAELAFAHAVEPRAAFSFQSTVRISYTWGL